MTSPHVAYQLLGPQGEILRSRHADREFYAASTVKLAVAATLLFAVEAGELALELTVPSRRRFASRVPGAGEFEVGAGELDPGMPADGTPVTLDSCLDRMIVFSSNEATNILVEALGGDGPDAGIRGLQAVGETCMRLGVPDVRMTRLICDYPARDAGFTHAATAAGLARLMWQITCGEQLSPESRDRLLALLRAQEFPIVAAALPQGAIWGSKSGWDEAIRHDVAVIGEPGHPDLRILAICTEGFPAVGAQEIIRVLAGAVLPEGGADES